MKLKTEQELQANYDRFIAVIKKYFKGERLEKLLHMYSEWQILNTNSPIWINFNMNTRKYYGIPTFSDTNRTYEVMVYI